MSQMQRNEPYTATTYARNPAVATDLRTTGPLFSSLDIVAGIVAILMNLGPLAAAAFVVGR